MFYPHITLCILCPTSGKICAKYQAVLLRKLVILQLRTFWWHFLNHCYMLCYFFLLPFLGILGPLNCFVKTYVLFLSEIILAQPCSCKICVFFCMSKYSIKRIYSSKIEYGQSLHLNQTGQAPLITDPPHSKYSIKRIYSSKIEYGQSLHLNQTGQDPLITDPPLTSSTTLSNFFWRKKTTTTKTCDT